MAVSSALYFAWGLPPERWQEVGVVVSGYTGWSRSIRTGASLVVKKGGGGGGGGGKGGGKGGGMSDMHEFRMYH